MVDFSARVILKFERSPRKTTGHLFYVTSRLVHHSVAIGELKLDLQPGNAQFGSNLAKCPVWHRNLMDNKTTGHIFCVTSSFVYHSVTTCKFETWVPARKRSIWVNIFLFRATLKFDRWSWKITGNLFYATSSFLHRFVTICESKLELRFRNSRTGVKLALTSITLTIDFWPKPFAWTSFLSMIITFENVMVIVWQEHCDKGMTDWQTDGQDHW